MLGLLNMKKTDAPLMEELFGTDKDKVLARRLVLSQIKTPDDDGIWCYSTKQVKVVIIGSDLLSLNIARQLALVCHYPNFDDARGKYRTIITIVSPTSKGKEDVDSLKNRFEAISGNLLSECIWKCISIGARKAEWYSSKTSSFLDVEFEFVGAEDVNSYFGEDVKTDTDTIVSVIDGSNLISAQTVSWIQSHCYQYYHIDETIHDDSVNDKGVDVRRAQVINMLYEASCHLEDVFVSDIYKIAAYKTALESFCLHTSVRKRILYWNSIKDTSLKISSLCCADFINTKIRSVKAGNCDMKHLNGKELECFARSEHTRWNVEKLISGFRPYTPEEKYADECLFSDPVALKTDRKRMKSELHAHIDICSCNELMRVDFDSYKYDCFLTLAADDIVNNCPNIII